MSYTTKIKAEAEENLDKSAENIRRWRECISPKENPDGYGKLLLMEREIRYLLDDAKSLDDNGDLKQSGINGPTSNPSEWQQKNEIYE